MKIPFFQATNHCNIKTTKKLFLIKKISVNGRGKSPHPSKLVKNYCKNSKLVNYFIYIFSIKVWKKSGLKYQSHKKIFQINKPKPLHLLVFLPSYKLKPKHLCWGNSVSPQCSTSVEGIP